MDIKTPPKTKLVCLNSKTEIFENHDAFKARKDEKINGVTKGFAEKNVNWREENMSNIGCWNCSFCSLCIGSTLCWNCHFCMMSSNCLSCKTCLFSEGLEECNDYIGQYPITF